MGSLPDDLNCSLRALRYSSYFVFDWTATFLPERSLGPWMPFGFPALTISTRCVRMYGTAGYCLTRSGVMKMPLITTSQRFAPSAGRRPPKELNTNFGLTFQCFAIAFAMSMSKPTSLPEVVLDSIGGNVGLSQYLNEPFTGDLISRLAPAVPTTAERAATRVTRDDRPREPFIAPPRPASATGRVPRQGTSDPSVNTRWRKMQAARHTSGRSPSRYGRMTG